MGSSPTRGTKGARSSVVRAPRQFGHIAQWLERYAYIVEVSRSSRDMPTNIGGGEVAGSSPALPTRNF